MGAVGVEMDISYITLATDRDVVDIDIHIDADMEKTHKRIQTGTLS